MTKPPRFPPTPVEKIRARIAYMLLWIFAGTIVLTFVAGASGWASPSDIRQFAAPIISAEIGLLGAVTGFYYASRAKDDDDSG